MISKLNWAKLMVDSNFSFCLKHAHRWLMAAQARYNSLLGITKSFTERRISIPFSLARWAGFLSFIVLQPLLCACLALRWWRSPRTSMGTNKQRIGGESVLNQAVWCNIRCWKTTLSFDRAELKTLHTALRAECGAQFFPVLEHKTLHNLLVFVL